jgi:hypothetical protein
MKLPVPCFLRVAAGCALALAATIGSAAAMEGGQTPSVRGYRDFLSGALPKPGVYVREDTYIYRGTERSTIPQGQLRVDLNAVTNILNATVVTPYQILGGNYAFGVRGAYTNISGVQAVTLNRPRVTMTRTGSVNAFNDIVVSPLIIGWHSGYFHWNVAATVWAPAGDYDKTKLVNTGRNYWSVAPQFSATYFDPKAGWDVSASSMYIVSYENTATHYNSGDIVQIDLAAGKMISPQFKLGVVGYYLQQVTADSGIGDILGDRKLRVAGVGPAATFSFSVSNVPLNVVAKYYREFSAQNTAQGGSGTLSLRAAF